jgi:hypothetical protein
MKTKNNPLKKICKELPGYVPTSGIWDNIENDLEFDELLNKKLTELPTYAPNPHSWKQIESFLDNEMTLKFNSYRTNTIRWVSTAAALVLSFIIIKAIVQFYRNTEKITYSEEIQDINPLTTVDANKEKMAINFLKEQCKTRSDICTSPEFQSKMEELYKLEMELDKLTVKERQYGTSEILIKSQIKIINFRSRLIKELISNLSS